MDAHEYASYFFVVKASTQMIKESYAVSTDLELAFVYVSGVSGQAGLPRTRDDWDLISSTKIHCDANSFTTRKTKIDGFALEELDRLSAVLQVASSELAVGMYS